MKRGILGGCLLGVAVCLAGCPWEEGPVWVRPETATIAVGSTTTIEAFYRVSVLQLYEWSSSDPTVAQVTAEGHVGKTATVTGLSSGQATITVQALDGGSASCVVTVFAEVAIAPETDTVVIGWSTDLVATSTDPRDESFQWSSSDLTVAHVNSSGTVTARGLGDATIEARGYHSNAGATAVVKVIPQARFNMDLPNDFRKVPPTLTREIRLEDCKCTMDFAGIAASIVNENAVLYHRLQLSGAAYTEDEGKAELPFYSFYFAIPTDRKTGEAAEYTVDIHTDGDDYIQDVLPYPSQGPIWLDEHEEPVTQQKAQEDGDTDRPGFQYDENFYQSAGPYPAERMTKRVFRTGNLNLLEIRVYPVRYYPSLRRLAMPHHLDVEVQFSSLSGIDAPYVVGQYSGRKEQNPEQWITECLANASIVSVLDENDFTRTLAAIDMVRPEVYDEGYELLILTRPALYEQALRLARYRQSEGIRVRLVNMGSGFSDWETIRDFIGEADEDNRLPVLIEQPPRCMNALLIFGDTELIPTCEGMIYRGYDAPTDPALSESIVGTDLYYTTIRSMPEVDWLGDISVGRISVDTIDQAEDVVDKIIQYESAATNPHHMAVYSYFQEEPRRVADLTGEVTFTVGSAVVTGEDTQFTDEISIPGFLDYIRIKDGYDGYEKWAQVSTVVSDTELRLTRIFGGPHDITGVAETGNLDGQDNWEFVKTAERVRQWMLGRGVDVRFGYARSRGPVPVLGFEGAALPADLLTYAWDADTALIQDNWSEGLDGIILHSDHGYRGGWGHPSFDKSNLVTLSNPLTGFYPIVFSINCGSGWFDNETDTRIWGDGFVRADTDTSASDESFCEAALRLPDGGAVAAVGAIRGSDAGRNDKLVDGLFASLYEDYNEGSIIEYWDSHPSFTRLGAAVQWAKLHQRSCLHNPTYEQYNMEIYHLIGDPMLRLNLPEP